MMSFFASSARAMKLRCASPFRPSNRPKANLRDSASSLITRRGRRDCPLRLPCHEDRTGARTLASPGGPRRDTSISNPAADESLAVEQPDARPDEEDVEHEDHRA